MVAIMKWDVSTVNFTIMDASKLRMLPESGPLLAPQGRYLSALFHNHHRPSSSPNRAVLL